MEAVTGFTIKALLTLGGGYVFAAVMLLLYLHALKDKKEQEKTYTARLHAVADSKDRLYEKLFTVSDRQTEIMTRVNTVLEHNDRTLDSVNGTLNALVTDRRRGR